VAAKVNFYYPLNPQVLAAPASSGDGAIAETLQ
jgi:hypothetical protein